MSKDDIKVGTTAPESFEELFIRRLAEKGITVTCPTGLIECKPSKGVDIKGLARQRDVNKLAKRVETLEEWVRLLGKDRLGY